MLLEKHSFAHVTFGTSNSSKTSRISGNCKFFLYLCFVSIFLIVIRGVNDKLFLAEIAAYQGKCTEAAKIYAECGKGMSTIQVI